MAERDGTLALRLLNVYGEMFNDSTDILLTHQRLTDRRLARNVGTANEISIPDLYSVPEGLYRLQVDPLGYRPVDQFINIGSAGPTKLEITCPVNPDKVISLQVPEFEALPSRVRTLLQASNAVLGYENKSGADLFLALDDLRKAGLLNIVAKCANTRVASGAIVLDSLQQLRECRGDRFFCEVTQQLREDVQNSVAAGLFFEASELLHHPPAGYSSAKSYKTPDRYGNLQLSFFTNGSEWVADIDIDDAGGLEHVFQVVRNFVEDRPTHPYDIHEILVAYQKIDPGYRFVV